MELAIQSLKLIDSQFQTNSRHWYCCVAFSYLNLHGNNEVICRVLRIHHDLVKQDGADLHVVKLANVPRAHHRLLKERGEQMALFQPSISLASRFQII